MTALIEIERLTKRFGTFTAVDDVSFSVARGEVLGFLGPNGAGKSTTMKMLAGFVTPSAGTARICGHDVQSDSLAARKTLGFLPEGAPTYPEMTVIAFLQFVARIRGYHGRDLASRVETAIGMTTLESVRLQPVETLSKGFKRRVGLAQALLHDPPVLVLDEPTDGLDPNQKHEVRTLIARMAPDKAIVISTHILEEVEAVCSRAIIIAQGRVVADATPAELARRHPFRQARRRVPRDHRQPSCPAPRRHRAESRLMRNTLIVARRELGGYFATPVAVVFIVIFLALQGVLTFNLGNFFERNEADLVPFFNFIPWVFLLLVPAITMRLWAEERRLGTIELLLTLPITQTEAVLGKFLAAWGFCAIALVLTFPFVITGQLSRPSRQRRHRDRISRCAAGRGQFPLGRRGGVGGDEKSGDRLRAGGGDLLPVRRRLVPAGDRLPVALCAGSGRPCAPDERVRAVPIVYPRGHQPARHRLFCVLHRVLAVPEHGDRRASQGGLIR